MEAYQKHIPLLKILGAVLAAGTVISGAVFFFLHFSGNTHIPLLILFFVLLALSIELVSAVSIIQAVSRSAAEAAASPQYTAELQWAAVESRLTGLPIPEKNAILRSREEQKREQQENAEAVSLFPFLQKFIYTPQPNPPHGDIPLEHTTPELFAQLSVDSAKAARTPVGNVMVTVELYNSGMCTVDGYLKADLYGRGRGSHGCAYLILPLNGIRPRQTVTITGICTDYTPGYRSVACSPGALFGYSPE